MSAAALVFMDTETTGLDVDDEVWEFAGIRRDPDGSTSELHLFIEHDASRCVRLPRSFLDDHLRRWPVAGGALTQAEAARRIHDFTAPSDPVLSRPHIVGAVPNFDTERLGALLRRNGLTPGWHYHLIDVETLAIGFLACPDGAPLPLPWSSDDLSRRVGVDPDQFARHTAMGDVRWAMAIYDAVMGTGELA